MKHCFAVCAYKDSPYLTECLDSLKAQESPSPILLCTATPSAYLEETARAYDAEYHMNPDHPGIGSDWNFALACAKAAGYDLTTYEKEEGDVNGPFALAVAISDTVDDGITGDIVWVSSAALVDDQTNTQVSGGNQDFFLNALGYLCQAEQSSLSIHAKSLSSDTLTMDSAAVSALTVAVVGVIPAAVITLGIVIWIRRKRR